MHESILNYRAYRYLWLSIGLCSVCLIAYLWHAPLWPANGGTWLGYTLGGLSAILTLWLLWLGVRKRRYQAQRSSLRGWTSAHIYLGLGLLIIATLHSGFQLGWNVHTLAYGLMWLVVLSGLWGLITYTTHPERITRNRNNQTRATIHQALLELDQETLAGAAGVSVSLQQQLTHALNNDPLRHPGSLTLWRLLSGYHWDSHQHSNHEPSVDDTLAQELANATESAHIDALRRLIDTIGRRNRLAQQLSRDLQLQAQLELWLYVHVPLSLAFLAALLAHVISVFFYW